MTLTFIIIIFLRYYIVIILHLVQYRHFYEGYFYIHKSKLGIYLLKHSYKTVYKTVTICEFIRQACNFKGVSSYNIHHLLNFRSLPELLQHIAYAKKYPDHVHYISIKNHGCDSMVFKRDDLGRIVDEKNLDLVTICEKKMGRFSGSNIPRLIKKYSVSHPGNGPHRQGARPGPVDNLEFGTYFREDYDILCRKLDSFIDDTLFISKPRVFLEDYSVCFDKVVLHPTKSGLAHGTGLKDSTLEDLKWFCDLLEKDKETLLYINHLIEQDPCFPGLQ